MTVWVLARAESLCCLACSAHKSSHARMELAPVFVEAFESQKSKMEKMYEKMGAKLIGEAELPEFGEDITELLYQWEL